MMMVRVKINDDAQGCQLFAQQGLWISAGGQETGLNIDDEGSVIQGQKISDGQVTASHMEDEGSVALNPNYDGQGEDPGLKINNDAQGQNAVTRQGLRISVGGQETGPNIDDEGSVIQGQKISDEG